MRWGGGDGGNGGGEGGGGRRGQTVTVLEANLRHPPHDTTHKNHAAPHRTASHKHKQSTTTHATAAGFKERETEREPCRRCRRGHCRPRPPFPPLASFFEIFHFSKPNRNRALRPFPKGPPPPPTNGQYSDGSRRLATLGPDSSFKAAVPPTD